MYRIKVALFAGLAIALCTALTFSFVTVKLEARAADRVETDVARAQKEMLDNARLDGFELANQAATFARDDELVQVFAKPAEKDKQHAAYVVAEVLKARVEHSAAPGREPIKVGIIGVIDESGRLLARDLQEAWRQGDDLTHDFPSLAVALKGQPNKDIWNLDGSMYRVGAAPIRGAQGNVLGAIFVGYVQSKQDALDERSLLGTEVAYFLDGKIHASSFQRSGDSSSESTEERALAAQLFDGPRLAEQAMAAHQATPLFKVHIGRDEWLAAAAPLPGNATQSKSGFVVLESETSARREVAPFASAVIGLGLAALIAILAAAVFTARRFIIPLDRLESGISEVINGNHDYTFESPSRDFEGLANLLNVMIARLLGRPDPDDEDEGGAEGAGEPDPGLER